MRCCVARCRAPYLPGSSLRFYSIPCGLHPLHARRRRLWLQAISRANGGGDRNELLKRRICGAHFLSGAPSMVPGSADFVPSVFESSQSPQTSTERVFGCKKKGKGQANGATPAGPTSTEDPQLSLMETEGEAVTAPAAPQEEEQMNCMEPLTDSKPECVELGQSSEVSTAASEPPVTPQRQMRPVVLLKRLSLAECQTSSDASRLSGTQDQRDEAESDVDWADSVVPEEEPSLPCNMCDRTFTTIHSLKRHKLLHVKDGRKCRKCGVLFCRQHKHLVFWPQPRPVAPADTDSSDGEVKTSESSLSPENLQSQRITEATDNASPLPEPVPPGSDVPVPQLGDGSLPPPGDGLVPPLSNRPVPPPGDGPVSPLCVVPFTPPCNRPVPPRGDVIYSPPVSEWSADAPSKVQIVPEAALTSDKAFSPCSSLEAPPLPRQIPSTFNLFSSEFLTSSLLEVHRNDDYISHRRRHVLPMKPTEDAHRQAVAMAVVCQKEHADTKPKIEKIAYDLEIIL